VTSGELTAGHNVTSFDYDSGFHLSRQTSNDVFRISDDHRSENSRFIEKTGTPSAKLPGVRSTRYVYDNAGGENDGKLREVVLTYADGLSCNVYRDANGRAVMQPEQ